MVTLAMAFGWLFGTAFERGAWRLMIGWKGIASEWCLEFWAGWYELPGA